MVAPLLFPPRCLRFRFGTSASRGSGRDRPVRSAQEAGDEVAAGPQSSNPLSRAGWPLLQTMAMTDCCLGIFRGDQINFSDDV
jgi:hypothetical protein